MLSRSFPTWEQFITGLDRPQSNSYIGPRNSISEWVGLDSFKIAILQPKANCAPTLKVKLPRAKLLNELSCNWAGQGTKSCASAVSQGLSTCCWLLAWQYNLFFGWIIKRDRVMLSCKHSQPGSFYLLVVACLCLPGSITCFLDGLSVMKSCASNQSGSFLPDDGSCLPLLA